MKNLKIVLVLLFSQFIFGTAKAQFNTLLGADPGCVAYNKASALCAVSSDDNTIYTYQLHSTFSELYGFSLSPISTTPPSFRATLPTNHNGNCATFGSVAVRIDRGQISPYGIMIFDNGEYSTTFIFFNTISNYYDNDCYYDTRER